MSLATAKPAFRTVECHAPMPGNRLKRTSGNPACARRSKMTLWWRSADSRPPPNVSPWTKRSRVHAYLRGVLQPPDEVDAAARVEPQRIEVAGADEQHEERQVAAEVEDVPDVRGHHEVPDEPRIGGDVVEDLLQLGHRREAVALDRLDADARRQHRELRLPFQPQILVGPVSGRRQGIATALIWLRARVVNCWKLKIVDSTIASFARSSSTLFRTTRSSAMCSASMVACELMNEMPRSPSRSSDP